MCPPTYTHKLLKSTNTKVVKKNPQKMKTYPKEQEG